MSQFYVQLHGLSSNMKEGGGAERGRGRERERERGGGQRGQGAEGER